MESRKLKKLRKEIRTSLENFAEVLGVPFRTYQNWEQPPESKEYRRIPDDVANRVRSLAEFKSDQSRVEYQKYLTWLQIPLRES